MRSFRDRYLAGSSLGQKCLALYYQKSPPIAEFIQGRAWARSITRCVLAPIVLIAGAILGETYAIVMLGLLGITVVLAHRFLRPSRTGLFISAVLVAGVGLGNADSLVMLVALGAVVLTEHLLRGSRAPRLHEMNAR